MGEATRLYFVRHGHSEANRLNVFSNRDAPHGLTAEGRAQVEGLAAQLAGVELRVFYASPIRRAVESAELLSARLGLPYRTTAALAEWDVGVLEGRGDPDGWRQYDALRERWRCGEHEARIEGGESLLDVRARFMPLIEQVRAEAAGGAALLLSHGGTLACMLPLLCRNVSPAFAQARGLGHCASVLVELRRDGALCRRWGDEVLESGA